MRRAQGRHRVRCKPGCPGMHQSHQSDESTSEIMSFGKKLVFGDGLHRSRIACGPPAPSALDSTEVVEDAPYGSIVHATRSSSLGQRRRLLGPETGRFRKMARFRNLQGWATCSVSSGAEAWTRRPVSQITELIRKWRRPVQGTQPARMVHVAHRSARLAASWYSTEHRRSRGDQRPTATGSRPPRRPLS